MINRFLTSLLLAFYCAQGFAEAAASGVDKAADTGVVAERGNVKLTFGDIDVFMEKVPAQDRPGVVAGSDRLQHIIDSELLNKQIAQRGRDMKLLDSPMIQRVLARAAEQELARITVDRIVSDTKRPDFNLVAKEYYVANKAEFATPVTSVVQHILISKVGRSAPEIAARVQEVLKKAQTPGVKFDALVNEYSDDPSKSDNQGVMSVGQPGEFIAAFETAAHAIKSEGDISQVDTEYGTHVLRLMSRSAAGIKPFEEVREQIITKISSEFEEGIRTKFFSDLRSASPIFHEEMIKAVRTRYGVPASIDPASPAPANAPAADGTK